LTLTAAGHLDKVTLVLEQGHPCTEKKHLGTGT
jgi:hypothetical protein